MGRVARPNPVNFILGHTRTHEKAWEASAGMFDSDVIAVLLLVLLLLLLLLLSRLLHSMEKNVCPPPHASRLQIQNAKQSSRRPHANRVPSWGCGASICAHVLKSARRLKRQPPGARSLHMYSVYNVPPVPGGIHLKKMSVCFHTGLYVISRSPLV